MPRPTAWPRCASGSARRTSWCWASEEIDLVALKQELADRGWAEQLCEGGPSLFADLLAAGVVDELCWTVVPRLTGGDAVRIAAGAEVDVTLRPALLLEQDGTLLGRWLVE